MDRQQAIYDALFAAVEKGFSALFSQHPDHYFYCALMMLEAAPHCIAAISEESVEAVLDAQCSDAQEKAEERAFYRWSYADSPYFGFGYEAFFGEVDALFNQDVWDERIGEAECEQRVRDWLRIMRDVMRQLEQNGMFRAVASQDGLFINAELQPPEDAANLENARVLNDEAVFAKWYAEFQDEYDFDA